MPSWKIHLLTAALLIAPTLHASVTSTGTTFQSAPLGSSEMNFYSPTQNYQSNFSNVGVPSYPIMGTATVYNNTSTTSTTNTTTSTETPPEEPATAPTVQTYNTGALVQQIINNYNQNLVYQQQNVNNPTNTGYGYVYSTPSISTPTYSSSSYSSSSSTPMYGSQDMNVYYGPTGPPPALLQQVALVTVSYNSGSNTLFLDAPGVTENPEPGTIVLLAGGLAAMFAIRRKLRNIR